MAKKTKKRSKKSKKGKSTLSKLTTIIIISLIGFVLSRYLPHTATLHTDLGDDLAIPQFTTSTNSQIIKHVGYTVSYNNKTRNPNWVGYTLTDEEVQGTVKRDDGFSCDPLVKGVQACDDDYKNSGYDRGHLAPAADMKWSKQAMEESFYLSNVSPQNKNLNRGVWKKLEELCRDKAELYGEIVIITGPVFNGNKQKTIGENHVRVPDAFFKVMLSNYDDSPRAIGFYMENKAGKKKLKEYAKSIDEIEAITSLDFFSSLPDNVEDEIERGFSAPFWGL